MQTNLSLHFLHEKINILQTALFFDTSSSILKVPTSIIKIMHVDEIGQLWFCLPAPAQSVNSFEKDFFCHLQFFQKGKNFYLNISGKAHIVNDPEEVNATDCAKPDLKQQVFAQEMMLIKVKIEGADYAEHMIDNKPEIKKANYRYVTNSVTFFSQFLRKHLFSEQRHHQAV